MEKLFSHSNRPKRKPEKNSGIKMVETSGYIPMNRRIDEMIIAGQRLNLSRADQYDQEDEYGDIPLDPTRKAGLDITDVTRIRDEVKERLRTQLKAKKEALQQVETKKAESTPLDTKG